jgi:hypothetical protein
MAASTCGISKTVYGCTQANGLAPTSKAEALVELLEIHDCGSIGGFDPEVGDSLHGLLYLEQRFEALKRKHAPKKTKKKKSRGEWTPRLLSDYLETDGIAV